MKNARIAYIIIFAAIAIALIATVIAVIAMAKEKPTVAITFDVEYPYGVPDNLLEQTSEQEWINAINDIVEIAESNDVVFQFNVLGKTAEKYPQLIKELSLSQDVSCHTYSHLYQTELNSSQKEFEISKCKETVESVITEEIVGNRFPFTDCDNESFAFLEAYGYKWDSSLFAFSLAELKPYSYKGIIEFPIFTMDDWEYFIYENKTDADKFYDILYSDITSIKDKDAVYVVLLHPWVLSLDESRIDGLDSFIEKLKESEIKIDSLDKIYKRVIA